MSSTSRATIAVGGTSEAEARAELERAALVTYGDPDTDGNARAPYQIVQVVKTDERGEDEPGGAWVQMEAQVEHGGASTRPDPDEQGDGADWARDEQAAQ